MLQIQPVFTRETIADHIVGRLDSGKAKLREEFLAPGRINACYVDDVLPDELAHAIQAQFPAPAQMIYKNTLREQKYIAAQMNLYPPILEEAIFSFQDPRVLDLISQITGLEQIEADVNLYAGGLSAMPKGNYLRPHLDNSHDKTRERYRVLNALY